MARSQLWIHHSSLPSGSWQRLVSSCWMMTQIAVETEHVCPGGWKGSVHIRSVRLQEKIINISQTQLTGHTLESSAGRV